MSTKAYAAATPKAALAPFSFDRRAPRPQDVSIDIKFCGICHSDIHQARDEWGASIFPMVPGHEIGGIVTAVGPKVTKFKVGDKVGVGCFVDSCRHCDSCRAGLEQYCTEHLVATYNGTEKDGTPTFGGYSEKIVVDENYVLRMPENLPLDAASPLLCAGITLYSPLKHWKAGPAKKLPLSDSAALATWASNWLTRSARKSPSSAIPIASRTTPNALAPITFTPLRIPKLSSISKALLISSSTPSPPKPIGMNT
jgi:uncharacterized zinc-type alcohol dehydrogenase-like protein